MANAYRPEYREYIARALADPSENVRTMAAWALERTKSS
jgi:HEAT repeat protein